MKLHTSLLAALMPIVAFCGIRQIDVTSGNAKLDHVSLPSRSAKIIGLEAITINTNDNGSLDLTISRPASAYVRHVDIHTEVETQRVISVKSVANHYTVAANYYGEAGAMADVQVSTFSNCYASTSKGANHGEKGTSRITFMPGTGAATQEYPTDYMVRVEFFGNYWYTNFTWESSSKEITLTSPPTSYPIYRVGIMRPLPPINILQTNNTEITTVTTNIWKEKVSRTVSLPVASIATTNGYASLKAPADTYVFAGDSLAISSTISNGAPKKVSVIISE